VLPMLVHIMDQPELDKGEGPIGLIVAPTRRVPDTLCFLQILQCRCTAVSRSSARSGMHLCFICKMRTMHAGGLLHLGCTTTRDA